MRGDSGAGVPQSLWRRSDRVKRPIRKAVFTRMCSERDSDAGGGRGVNGIGPRGDRPPDVACNHGREEAADARPPSSAPNRMNAAPVTDSVAERYNPAIVAAVESMRHGRVALVHDWLTGMRGGERCLEVFCELFPDADLYTLLHVPGSVSATIERRRIVTSFVQRLPGAAQLYRYYLPLFPAAVASFDLSAYDLVLS